MRASEYVCFVVTMVNADTGLKIGFQRQIAVRQDQCNNSVFCSVFDLVQGRNEEWHILTEAIDYEGISEIFSSFENVNKFVTLKNTIRAEGRPDT